MLETSVCDQVQNFLFFASHINSDFHMYFGPNASKIWIIRPNFVQFFF